MRLRFGLLVAALGSWGCVFAGAQTAMPPASHASLPAPVTIHVTVTDKAGNAVTGLQKSDFTLFDDDHASPIQGFSASPGAPPLVVLVVDQVNEPFRALSIEQQQLETFVSQNQGHLPYPVSLIFLTDSGLSRLSPRRTGMRSMR